MANSTCQYRTLYSALSEILSLAFHSKFFSCWESNEGPSFTWRHWVRVKALPSWSREDPTGKINQSLHKWLYVGAYISCKQRKNSLSKNARFTENKRLKDNEGSNHFCIGRQLTITLHNCFSVVVVYFVVSFLACELNATHFQEKKKKLKK